MHPSFSLLYEFLQVSFFYQSISELTRTARVQPGCTHGIREDAVKLLRVLAATGMVTHRDDDAPLAVGYGTQGRGRGSQPSAH